MDKLFLTVLNMSLTGAFVIAVVMLARLPLRKAPKIISYCLWAVVGFRLIFPFTIESKISLMPFETVPVPAATTWVDRPFTYIEFIEAQGAIPESLVKYPDDVPLTTYIVEYCGFAWLAGAAVMLIYGTVSFARLKRRMRSAIRVDGNIYETDNIQSPFVLGFFKPKIYLPLGISGQERDYIILHEQTHLKRRDHIVKFSAYSILCLHWFNPLAWAAFLLMGVDMEMSCDERVLKEIGGETKKDYSMSLLALNPRSAPCARLGPAARWPLAFSEGGLKARVKNVLRFRKPSRAIITLSVALVTVLSVGFAVNRAPGEPSGEMDLEIINESSDAAVTGFVPSSSFNVPTGVFAFTEPVEDDENIDPNDVNGGVTGFTLDTSLGDAALVVVSDDYVEYYIEAANSAGLTNRSILEESAANDARYLPEMTVDILLQLNKNYDGLDMSLSGGDRLRTLFMENSIVSMPQFQIMPHYAGEYRIIVIAHVIFNSSDSVYAIAVDYRMDFGYSTHDIYFISE